MATRIFRNTNQDSQFHNQLLTIASNQITKVHNIFEQWVENLDFDNDEEESEDNPRKKLWQDGEDYYLNSEGQLLNSQIFSHGVGQTYIGSITVLNEDGTVMEPAGWQGNGGWVEVYIYWDGHNYKALHLKDDIANTEWEEVTNELGADFEDKLIQVGRQKEQYAENVYYVHPTTRNAYRLSVSAFPGPDYYEPIKGGLMDDKNILDDQFSETEISGLTAEFFAQIKNNKPSLTTYSQVIDGAEYILSLHQLPESFGFIVFEDENYIIQHSHSINNTAVTVYIDLSDAELAFNNRKADLKAIANDHDNREVEEEFA